MKRFHGKAAYLVVGVAAVVSIGGAAAVQAQPASNGGSADKVLTAKGTVAAHPNRFGFGPGQALTEHGVFTDKTGSAIRFDRTYRGLPVIGGELVVHITRTGAYRYGDGRKVVGLPTSVTPALPSAAASKTAADKMPYAVATSSAELVVFASVHSSALAWQVSTASKDGLHGDVTYVSATTGGVLASWPTVMTDNGTGKTLYSGTVSLKDKKNGNKYLLQDNTRGTQRIYDANNSSTVGSGTLFKDTNNVWGNGTTSSRESAGADAGYGLAETWDFYLHTFGRHGIADDGVAANAYVHYSTNYANANWSDGCFCMIFGDGNTAIGWGPLVTLDVGGHEMTHGVTSRTAGLIYSGESGGLNESTSDVMGTQVEWYANNANDVPDYMIGEEFYLQYDPEVNYLRRMDQPSLDGGSADCWYSGVGNLDVHYSSGVGNHLFYLLSEGSGSKTINGLAYNSPTCNGKTVVGIGHVKAAAIWYKALTENWVPTTDYHDARVGMLQAAADLYGANSTAYKAVNKAWAAVNVSP